MMHTTTHLQAWLFYLIACTRGHLVVVEQLAVVVLSVSVKCLAWTPTSATEENGGYTVLEAARWMVKHMILLYRVPNVDLYTDQR